MLDDIWNVGDIVPVQVKQDLTRCGPRAHDTAWLHGWRHFRELGILARAGTNQGPQSEPPLLTRASRHDHLLNFLRRIPWAFGYE